MEKAGMSMRPLLALYFLLLPSICHIAGVIHARLARLTKFRYSIFLSERWNIKPLRLGDLSWCGCGRRKWAKFAKIQGHFVGTIDRQAYYTHKQAMAMKWSERKSNRMKSDWFYIWARFLSIEIYIFNIEYPLVLHHTRTYTRINIHRCLR